MQSAQQRLRVGGPHDVRVRDEDVAAGEEDLADELRLEEPHAMEEVRRVAEVRRGQRARVIVRGDAVLVQREEERLVERRDDHLPSGAEGHDVVGPIEEHLCDAAVTKRKPRVSADGHVLQEVRHRSIRRATRRQLLGRIRWPPARHAVCAQELAHVV